MRNRFVFEEHRMVGMRDHTGQWWKVVEDCVRCGKCCMDVPMYWRFYDKEKGCKYLELEDDGKTYRCDLGAYRPIGCSCNSPFSIVEYCSVKLEKIDDPSSLL